MTFKELRKELRQYIYPIQYSYVYGGSEYPGNAQYYSNRSLNQLLIEANTQISLDLKVNPTPITNLSPNFKNILLFKTTILAIRNVIQDLENNIEKPKVIFTRDEKILSSMTLNFMAVLYDYENVYQILMEDFKKTINLPLYKIEKPFVKEDETLVIKVGNEERPATDSDIQNVQSIFAQTEKNQNLTIVTHHVISFTIAKTKDLVFKERMLIKKQMEKQEEISQPIIKNNTQFIDVNE